MKGLRSSNVVIIRTNH